MVLTLKEIGLHGATFLHVGTIVNAPPCNSLYLFLSFLCHPYILTSFGENISISVSLCSLCLTGHCVRRPPLYEGIRIGSNPALPELVCQTQLRKAAIYSTNGQQRLVHPSCHHCDDCARAKLVLNLSTHIVR